MVDSDIYRKRVLPSEKAFAYNMKLEAIKHQGKTSAAGLHKSREDIGIANDESGEFVRRYVRLTYLIPELLQLIDDIVKYGKNQILTMGIKPVVEISYLTKEEQITMIYISKFQNSTIETANSNDNKKLPYEIDFILDEFANCPPLADIEAIVLVARSREMHFHFFYPIIFPIR